MKRPLFVLALLGLVAAFTALPAQPPPAPDKAKQDIEKLIKANEELQKQIDALKKQPQPMPPGPAGPVPVPPPAPGQGRGYIPPTPAQRAALHETAKAAHGKRIAMLEKFQALPTSFDCRAKGWAAPMGDQGNCGSCYLYSTAQCASGAFVKAGYGKPENFAIAIQYGMDCHNFGGCNGGYGLQVIDWMCKNGFPAEYYTDVDGTVHHDYPGYSARSQSCRKVAGAKYWKPASWGFCTSDQSDRTPTTEEVKTAMYNYGMLNLAIDAGGQFSNGTGTITSLGSNIDHEINVVAWDDAKDGGAFLLQNQWGTGWGQGGYRWCTYAAFKKCVDVFWVTATPLPPPPDLQVAVPALIGKPYATAQSLCRSSGLGINPATAEPTAIVTAQYPDAGLKVDAGFTVQVTLDAIPPPPIGGDIVITVPAGSPGGKYTVISDTDKASIAAKIEEICQLLKPGPDPVTSRVPIIAPQKWVRDGKVAAQLAKAMEKQAGGAEAYKKLAAADPTAHPMLMRALWRKMRADPQGEKILAAYMKSAEKPADDGGGADEVGTPFTDILDWIIKNGPAIMSLIMTIIGLFG